MFDPSSHLPFTISARPRLTNTFTLIQRLPPLSFLHFNQTRSYRFFSVLEKQDVNFALLPSTCSPENNKCFAPSFIHMPTLKMHGAKTRKYGAKLQTKPNKNIYPERTLQPNFLTEYTHGTA